jgi:hypothetical protein
VVALSTDGTVVLLEVLSQLGIINLIHQEQKKKAQLDTYKKLYLWNQNITINCYILMQMNFYTHQ